MADKKFKFEISSKYVRSFMCNGQVQEFDWANKKYGVLKTDDPKVAKAAEAQGYFVAGPGFAKKVES